jgi:hypothetical protein
MSKKLISWVLIMLIFCLACRAYYVQLSTTRIQSLYQSLSAAPEGDEDDRGSGRITSLAYMS